MSPTKGFASMMGAERRRLLAALPWAEDATLGVSDGQFRATAWRGGPAPHGLISVEMGGDTIEEAVDACIAEWKKAAAEGTET